MPRFDFNPADAVSGLPVFPKNSYQIELGEPKSFYRQGKGGKADNYGVMFRGKIVEGEYKGKPVMINCYLHNEDSLGFTKSVQMAALGFMPRKEDDDFNKSFGGEDWSINTDDKSVGDGWNKMKGQVLIADLDTQTGENGELQQKTIGYRPLKSEAA